MAKELTEETKQRAEEIRGLDIGYNQKVAIELRDIFNNHSGQKENDCLCTKSKRQTFKTKFFKWYDFRM